MGNAHSPVFTARRARSAEEVAAALRLRASSFGHAGEHTGDAWDADAAHILIEDSRSGALVCCFRMRDFTAADIEQSYSARFYGLEAFKDFEGLMVEVGRFCVAPGCSDPDILRLAWSVITQHVDDRDARLLFGCSSFQGTEPDAYLDTFAMLRARYLAPRRWLPRIRAPEVFRYAARLRRTPDPVKALRSMPPLLRSYLMMGGWVSDHAVIDRQMNTLHVFTGIEISAIPATRKRLLRALV
ncbi:GNAT family N-acetyltransferase [uncultured Roseobacter sp.]|uniref:GNAT family N-acetyltransferase n=1 Tax=uncultured Roseobacter sp. TaxID=114847 RepID=UPI002633658D|nr:GNAT family N-acetyltransferase [uncultured Roseobacter sp.]